MEEEKLTTTKLNIEPASSPTLTIGSDSIFSVKDIFLVILVGLLFLSFLGINLLAITGNLIEESAKIIVPTVLNVISIFGYSTGEFINTSADVASDVTKLGVDIAEGTVQDIGNLLKNASQGSMDEKQKKDLDRILSSPKCPYTDTEPTPSDSSIQNQIAAQKPKAGWCFVGEYDGSRGCVGVDEIDKCMSGQIFPSQKMCLNPTLTQNA